MIKKYVVPHRPHSYDQSVIDLHLFRIISNKHKRRIKWYTISKDILLVNLFA